MTKTIVRGLIFVALPLCALETLLLLGVLPPARNLWFDRVIAAACHGRVDFVIAGSSRVAAAIDTGAFARRISDATGRPATAINTGRGYTTLVEHDLALRKLYDTCGDNVEGAAVLIEAPEGLPDFATFRDSWVHPDQPELVAPLMRWRDLRRFWTESRTPLTAKVGVTAHLVPSLDYIDVSRRRLRNVGNRLLRRLASRLPGGAVAAEPSAADLASSGGILVEPQDVERARRLAVSLAPSTFSDDRPVSDWSATVLMDINRLVRSHRGRLMVFRMPLSSVQQTPYRAPGRRDDIESFRGEAVEACISYLDPQFVSADEDFPDYWHLRKSRADEFSRLVADQYLLATLKRPSIGEHRGDARSEPTTDGSGCELGRARIGPPER